MAKFKVIVSDPFEGKSKVFELEGTRAVPLISRRLGEIVDGAIVGLSGHKLQITGGSDKDGFPMRPNVHGGVRVSVVLSKGVGFHPQREGERQRKTLRGNVITEEIVQVNMKIVEKPKKAEKPKKEKKVKSEVIEGEEKETEATAKVKSEKAGETAQSGGEPSEEVAQTT
jgi:small subunit ribosomal protein S6e